MDIDIKWNLGLADPIVAKTDGSDKSPAAQRPRSISKFVAVCEYWTLDAIGLFGQ